MVGGKKTELLHVVALLRPLVLGSEIASLFERPLETACGMWMTRATEATGMDMDEEATPTNPTTGLRPLAPNMKSNAVPGSR